MCMALPVLAAVSAGLSAVGTGVAAIQSYSQSKYQQRVADANRVSFIDALRWLRARRSPPRPIAAPPPPSRRPRWSSTGHARDAGVRA